MNDSPLTFQIRIEAPADVVFRFFTDADDMARWLGTHAEVDAIADGSFVVTNERDVVEGRFLEVVPYSRIVFTWGWRAGPYADSLPPGASTVEVSLEGDGDATILTLAHRHVSDDMRQIHQQGWQHCLGRLIAAAGGVDPGVDTWAAGCQAEDSTHQTVLTCVLGGLGAVAQH